MLEDWYRRLKALSCLLHSHSHSLIRVSGQQPAHQELVRVKCLSQGHVTVYDARTRGIKLLIFQLADNLLNHSCQALGGNIFYYPLTMKPVIAGRSCAVSS